MLGEEQRTAETPAETEERRRRRHEYMRRIRANISFDEQRQINREYTQRRRANNASEQCQHTDHSPFFLSDCSNILIIANITEQEHTIYDFEQG